jgi:hypothetical protein
LLITVHATQAQTEFSSGLILEDATYDTIQKISNHPGLKASLPVKVSLEAYCPEVRHQGDIFSCVGWATGYAAMSIQRAIYNQCTDRRLITEYAHSALFVFNQVKADCAKGAKLSDALRFLREKGDCLAREFDFDVNDCEKMPNSAQQTDAKRYAVSDYLSLFESDAAFTAKVEQTKMALAAKKVVIVGLNVRRNFYQLPKAKYWWPDNGNTAPAGGHALVVVGYDDLQGAFRLFNSWGKEWGEEGYIWIKYEYFAQFCKYAYIIQLTGAASGPGAYNPVERPLAARPMTQAGGAFSFQHLDGYGDSGAIFSEDSVVFNGRYYSMLKKDWPVGQLFQLLVNNEVQEEYLYVLSLDAQRQFKVHFPRPENPDARTRTGKESGLVLPGNATLTVPGPNKALKISQMGVERLIVLYSKRPINDLEGLGKILSAYQGDFYTFLLQALNKYAIPLADIRYHPRKMFFSASTRSDGYIVPIMLEVIANTPD